MKKIILFANSYLACMAIICLTLNILLSLFCSLISFFNSSFFATNFDRIVVGIIFCAFVIAFLILGIICAPKWFVRLEISSGGIKHKIPFKKTVNYSYNYYKNIYIATYFHGILGRGHRPKFLVISHYKLPQHILTQINKIPISTEIIKIRCSEKKLKRIYEFLPENLQNKLKQKYSITF